jgi:hypothetical protein
MKRVSKKRKMFTFLLFFMKIFGFYWIDLWNSKLVNTCKDTKFLIDRLLKIGLRPLHKICKEDTGKNFDEFKREFDVGCILLINLQKKVFR